MNVGQSVKQISRNYSNAIKSATSGRFTIKQVAPAHIKKSLLIRHVLSTSSKHELVVLKIDVFTPNYDE